MFCPACGTQNPDGAKFCAKCGKSMQAGEAKNPATPEPEARVAPAARSNKEPAPGAPGPQTQFFMAAAGVSTGAKIKRLVIFILVILIVGAGVFFGLRFAMEQQRLKDEAAKQQPSTEASAEPVAPTAPAATPAAPSGETPPAAPGTEAKPTK